MPNTSPAYRDLDQYAFPAFDPEQSATADNAEPRRSSDESGTLRGSNSKDQAGSRVDDDGIDRNKLHICTSYDEGDDDHMSHYRDLSPMSPSKQREQSRRLDDELEMLRAEAQVQEKETARDDASRISRTRSMVHTRSRTAMEPEDDFDIGSTPVYEQTKAYKPPVRPATKLAKLAIRIHHSSFLVRYFCYIAPVALIIMIPLLLGALQFKGRNVGGVELMWFCIWLQICWLTLWLGRIIAKCIPYPMGVIASLFSNNDKMFRDLGKQLELPLTLFFWWLAIEISFLPTMTNHHVDGNRATKGWEGTMNKVIVSIFVGATLNFVEKVIIQLIAISFHLRTYADRIEINKFETQSLVKLYIYSKEKIAMEDSEFELPETAPSSGIRTPMKYISKAGKGARQALYKVGDVAGKVAGDFTGRAVATSTHPQQVILQLLSSTSGAQVLARRLYRTYCPEGAETVNPDDLRVAFESNEEADAAFSMFDKDMNGDISMEELEAVCVEIGRERKAITASLKDLDSVVSKLDHLFLFIVAIITILVFISLISTSAAGVLTSAGSAVLALSWLFSATAQEVLQSIVFVFIKHPFDVGDRVTIYGNTGKEGLGDDYFVKEISLLFTEFKKMEGHVVQAPNSYLNTLFILNQRRSGGLAEAVPVTMKFGTTLEQLDGLRQKLLDFVGSERREYQHNILTELKTVFEAYSISMNVVFFYKSNWQNELLRLQRRNKFICALMVSMQELGIEGPRRTWAGQNSDAPMYMQYYQPPTVDQPPPGPLSPLGGPRDSISNPIGGRRAPSPGNLARQDSAQTTDTSQIAPRHSILRHSTLDRTQQAGRGRGESLTQMSKRVDFSLGMSTASQGDIGDVFDKPKPRIPVIRETSPSPERKNKDLDGHSLGRSTSRDTNETGDSRSRSRWGSKRILGSLAHPGRRSIEHNDLESRIEGSGAIPAAVPAGPGPIERGIPMQELPPTHPPLHSAAGHRGTVDHLPGIPEAASRPGSVAMSQPPAVTVADRRATVEEEVDNDTKASGKTL